MSRHNGNLAFGVRPDCKLGKLRTRMTGKHFAHEDGYDGYDMVEILPKELTATASDYLGGNPYKKTLVLPEGLTELKGVMAPVFPNLKTVIVDETTEVVEGLDTGLASLYLDVVVANSKESSYETKYALATNLNFDSWVLDVIVTIPFVDESELTSEYVERFVSLAGGDPSSVNKVIIPKQFTSYESGVIDTILDCFPSLTEIVSQYENGDVDIDLTGDIAAKI